MMKRKKMTMKTKMKTKTKKIKTSYFANHVYFNLDYGERFNYCLAITILATLTASLQ